MPRLGPWVPRTVFFAYQVNSKTGKKRTVGTGVFIGAPDRYGNVTDIYAATCHHVSQDTQTIRINTLDGTSREIDIEPDLWETADTGDDLAIADVTELFTEGDNVSVVPLDLLIDRAFIAGMEFGIGEDGFMLGLFADLPGKNRNLVAARFGNVSLLAENGELIVQGNKRKRPSHLFDMHSRPGFSGSPVFVYRTPDGDIRDVAYGPIPEPSLDYMFASDSLRARSMRANYESWKAEKREGNMFIRLLGIHSAQYSDSARVIDKETVKKLSSSSKEANIAIRDGDVLKIPNSMAVVVPSWEIIPVLNKPVFVKKRLARKEAEKLNIIARNDPEPESTSAKAENRAHREDFNSLVNAAARKREPKD